MGQASKTEPENGAFGVFILRGGAWKLWTTGPEGYVRRERDYLTGSLGVTAQVFRKAA